MKWLKRTIRNWLREDNYDRPDPEPAPPPGPDIEGIRFTLMAAHGGCILQTSTYDQKHDTRNFQTYLITDSEDIAERVGQIVALEIYRR